MWIRNLAVAFLVLYAGTSSYASSLSSIVPASRTHVEEADTAEMLDDLVVVRKKDNIRFRGTPTNTEMISAAQLLRAACCNLGESFTTNPSVDVSYSDAATGARQIRLLGLSGRYVQMLNENIPAFRGLASPYGLSYIAGPWMKSISVSKGAGSVKNGYESITGQINIELRKPQLEEEFALNGYVDSEAKVEANLALSKHLTQRLSTSLLGHYEKSLMDHDANGDGFSDMPRVEQLAWMNRWAWMGESYVFQGAVKVLDEKRRSGQTSHGHESHALVAPIDGSETDPARFSVGIDTRRIEAFTKNAYIFDKDNDGSVALMISTSWQDLDFRYGFRSFDARQNEVYLSAMFERSWAELHKLSAGLSFQHDRLAQRFLGLGMPEKETAGGIYAQYTLNLDTKFVGMAGIRLDRSSLFGWMVTPRVHLKWNPTDVWSFHATAGRGFRNPHYLADYSYLLASAREIVLPEMPLQEKAWNFGGGVTANIPIGWRTLAVNAEYYYTRFSRQIGVDLDSDPHQAIIRSGIGISFSHAAQIDATIDIIEDLNMMVAVRYADARIDFGKGLRSAPLESKWKGLMTVSYSPFMGLWQFDLTLAVNGPGRMPDPDPVKPLWEKRFKAYPALNIQVTRNFRRWAVYIGGENLTNYRQPAPVVSAANPWSSDFDATMIYGPLHGAMAYIGFRFNL